MVNESQVIESTEELPVSRSADRDNFYFHYCDQLGQQAHYMVCLHKIEERKEGRLKSVWAECSAAIGNKQCPALAMRKEELRVGKAIYFVPKTQTDKVVTMIRPSISVASRKQAASPAPVTKPEDSTIQTFKQLDFAEVVNAIAEKKEEPKPAPTLKLPTGSGGSLLEMARQMMKQKGENK